MARDPSAAAARTESGAARFERIAALGLVFIIAVRYRLPPDIPIGFLVSAAALPVTIRCLWRFRGAPLIAALTVIAAACGVLLTLGHAPVGETNGSLLAVQTWRVLGIALVLAALLWVRTVVGVQPLVLTFGLGSLASLAVTGINLDNIWKYSLAVPVTLILLSLPGVFARRGPQFVVVLILAGISAFNDSRSSASMFLIAAALTLFQRRPTSDIVTSARRAWRSLAQLALAGVGAYFALQAAILEGMLGDSVRARTEMQIAQSGSAIVGGRPEMGATIALIADRPWGYGAGTLASYDQIMLGKSGMAALGYDPNNGYVENYMFGYGLEVHSLLGDLWLIFGIAGAVLAFAMLGFSLYGVGVSLSTGAATTVVLFLVLRFAWDFAFSPIASAMVYVPLALAVTLSPRARPHPVQ